MLAKPIQHLVDFFLKFPGVGPKQATRFVFYLLREEPERVRAFARAITHLHEEVKLCVQCYKTFDIHPQVNAPTLCELCRNSQRNQTEILVVEKEVDLQNIERTRKFDGLYHVLGGTISPLDASLPEKMHLKKLFERVEKLVQSGSAVEVILATNPTTEGDATALYLERVFTPLRHQFPAFKISRLGRGLTTGSELEYSDEITIANALLNRK